MRLAPRAFVVPLPVELAVGSVVDAAMSPRAPAPGPTAPVGPRGQHRPGSFTSLVILAFAYLLCLAPLLHAHPANQAGPAARSADAHPIGIHLPEQTRAPAFLGADEGNQAPAVAPDSRALATIVVAESHRRDGSPTPPPADPSTAGQPGASAAALRSIGAAWPPVESSPTAPAPWPAYCAQAPPAAI